MAVTTPSAFHQQVRATPEDLSSSSDEDALDKVKMIQLETEQIVLMLPHDDQFDHLADSCLVHMAKPFVVSDHDTLEALYKAIENMDVSNDVAFWVGIDGLTSIPSTVSCMIAQTHHDRAVCFKDFDTFKMKYPGCLTESKAIKDLTLRLEEPHCLAPPFRPICENGVDCSEETDYQCGQWIEACSLRGTCLVSEEFSPGVNHRTCRYISPTTRLTENQWDAEHFNVSCDFVDTCLKTSSDSTSFLLKESYSFNFYKDGQIMNESKLENTVKVKMEEIDSTFQCKYKIGGIFSNISSAVSRPKIVPDQLSVLNGGHAEFTCVDSSIDHLSAEQGAVTYEWSLPSYETRESITDKLIIESFVDAGGYRCRSSVDGTWSVWSNLVQVSLQYEDPVLIPTPATEISQGIPVTLTCSASGLASFTCSFFKDGDTISIDPKAFQFHIDSFTSANEGNYTCSIAVSNQIVGSSKSIALVLQPVDPPEKPHEPIKSPVLRSDKGDTIREGQPVTLICEMFEAHEWNLKYSFSFTSLSSNSSFETTPLQSPDFLIDSFSAQDEGTYQCGLVHMEDGAVEVVIEVSNSSNSITLRLVTAVLVSTATTVPEGSDIHLLCNVNNYNGTVERYSWFKGGLNAIVHTSTTSDTQIIKNFQSKHDGVYRCQAILSDPQLAGPPLTSRPLSLVSVPRFHKCSCVCSNKSLSLPAVTPEVIDEATQAIQKNLSVEKDQLSSKVRRVSSAPDSRPSSVSAGYIAVALLSVVVGLILIPDLTGAAVLLFKGNTWQEAAQMSPTNQYDGEK